MLFQANRSFSQMIKCLIHLHLEVHVQSQKGLMKKGILPALRVFEVQIDGDDILVGPTKT